MTSIMTSALQCGVCAYRCFLLLPPVALSTSRCHTWKLAGNQGLTLVHFSAQPKPFWSHFVVSSCLIDWGKSCTQRIPQNVLTLSRKVDEGKPLPAPRSGGR